MEIQALIVLSLAIYGLALDVFAPTTVLKESPPYVGRSDIVCCECVPFYLCVNGTINSDGSGLLDLRFGGNKPTKPTPIFNVVTCPDRTQTCCQVPDASPSCFSKPTTTPPVDSEVSMTPDPNSFCECLPYILCDPQLVVSNGLGLTTIELNNGRKVSHSLCKHSLDVCCYLPYIFLMNLTEPKNDDDNCECVEPFLCGPDGHIQAHGIGVINVRLGSSVPRKVCPHDPKLVCCLPPKTSTPLPQSTESTALASSSKPNIQCECVVPILCGSDGHIRTDGAGLLDLRIGPTNNLPLCPHNSNLVCCLPPKEDIKITSEIPSTSVSPTTQADESCECVEPILCGPDGFIKTDGAGLLDVRIGPLRPPPRCPYDPRLVCCRPPVQSQITTEVPSSPNPSLPPLCGVRNSNGIGVRILGFKEGQTQFGEFPWVASVLKHENILGRKYALFVGGASLIHPRVVLTAAHKVAKASLDTIFVRLGEWDTTSTKEALPHRDIPVEKIIFHPNYTPGPLFHDVALLILEEEVNKAFHINTICIAKSLDEIEHTNCVTNGWGVDGFRSENYQEIMKSVNLPLVNKKRCERLLRKTRLSRHFTLHNSFICAGGEEGIDSCKGDGGGPLACPKKGNPSQYLQVGITAWGIGCGKKDVPGVYADVSVHYDWIANQINSYFRSNIASHRNINIKRVASAREKYLRRREKRRKERARRREQRLN